MQTHLKDLSEMDEDEKIDDSASMDMPMSYEERQKLSSKRSSTIKANNQP
jgi:hypothetical protein